MYDIINDRVFWIYFIVTLFFIIIGIGSIMGSGDPYMLLISIIWLLSNIALMILTYHASLRWGPTDINDNNNQICVIDQNSGCFDTGHRVWLFINVIFIALLILSVLWAAELGNSDSGALRTMSGVLILLGGLLLCGFASGYKFMHNIYIIPFWMAVGYLVIWFGLTFYVATS